MNAVIACGGTGGHLFPGIAVAEVLRDRGHEVMLLVSEKDIDALALSGRESFRVEKLPTVGLPSPFSPAIFGFLRRFYESLALCRSIYQDIQTSGRPWDGRVHFHRAGIGGPDARHSHFYSRIKRRPRKSEPFDSADSAHGHARL